MPEKEINQFPKKICIITPDYLSTSPRVIKEADALSSAGFEIRVVFTQGPLDIYRGFDEQTLMARPWKKDYLKWSNHSLKEKYYFWKTRLRHNLFQNLPINTPLALRCAEYAEGRLYGELRSIAAQERADLFIGHYPTGLAAAAYAAKRWDALLGYDVEDLHTEEFSALPRESRRKKRVALIERRYIPLCRHISVVSELISQEFINRYNVTPSVVVHNVFPFSERKRLDNQRKDRQNAQLSLYWYSQTIGEGRGIEDAIKALGILKESPVELHLRGALADTVKKKFLQLASQWGSEKKIFFHPLVAPDELLSRTAEHDVGLALEVPSLLSRRLTITNKLFFYLLAGLALAVSDVPGQRRVFETIPGSGFLYPPGDFHFLAGKIKELIDQPSRLDACKRSSLMASQELWNWEKESQKLVSSITKIFHKEEPA